ncbi:endonuclease III domain-containing protein [Desulfovibrio mangrovi]|uniref:endonuclease III domain-containing protein n=1 Tax=Desulfovibrio mangrovi TaxID=2976983 RepID=UPI003B84A71D
MSRADLLLNMYQSMLDRLGPSHWWPGETPFEVAVGAILTQNTNWGNVERAIANITASGSLSPHAMLALPDAELAELIRPSGYYNMKAKRLKAFLLWLQECCESDITRLGNLDAESARKALLSVKGIGPETADSIALYAASLPTFVVDAYTLRIFSRHGLVPEDTDYHTLRDFFMDVLPHDVALFNEFHALIVRVGKEWCRKGSPRCEECPLGSFLEGDRP